MAIPAKLLELESALGSCCCSTPCLAVSQPDDFISPTKDLGGDKITQAKLGQGIEKSRASGREAAAAQQYPLF